MSSRAGDLLEWAENLLHSKGILNSSMEALWLLCEPLGISASDLLLRKEERFCRGDVLSFRKRVERRAQRIPLAYILGTQEFMGLDFFVNKHTLIPRPETEVLVEQILENPSVPGCPLILDVGTGSGNIAIALAKNKPGAKIISTDISPGALAVAKRNAKRHKVQERITFLKRDLFPEDLAEGFNIIVSNPPYVRSEELESLQEEIHFEPKRALFGGRDGLKVIRRLLSRSRDFLKDRGLLFLEIGHGQSGEVKEMMDSSGFRKVEAVKDQSGAERVIIGGVHG